MWESLANGTEISERMLVVHMAEIGMPEALIRWAARELGADERTALEVAWCESRWDPVARGDFGYPAPGPRPPGWDGRPDYWAEGLWQIRWDVHHARILPLGFTREDLRPPWPATVVMMSIWRSSGWAPWSCSLAN